MWKKVACLGLFAAVLGGDVCYDAYYDLDGDCNINIVDIMLVAVEWGKICE